MSSIGIVVACGSAVTPDDPSPADASTADGSTFDGTTFDGTTTGDGGPSFGNDGGPTACVRGEACTGDGVCVADGVCCAKERACGANCCASGSACSFGACVVPGKACVDAADCAATEMCEYALGDADAGTTPVDAGSACTGTRTVRSGRCIPRPPRCAGGEPEGTCLQKCEVRPTTGAFTPVLKHSWGQADAGSTKDSVMMSPIVVQLDDDNCDGRVDERDIPEILFTTFTAGQYRSKGNLHAISIVDRNDGQGARVVEKWTTPTITDENVRPSAQLAGGNIDGVPGNEIVGCISNDDESNGRARAFRADGSVLWTSVALTCATPAIADLDGDGKPEVVVNDAVLDGKTGVVKFTLSGASEVTVADLDGDGSQELVSTSAVWNAQGMRVANALANDVTGGALPVGRYVGLGDLDKDGKPEILVAHTAIHALSVWQFDTTMPSGVRVVRRTVDINGSLAPELCPDASAGRSSGGGPVTVADFDGDGTADVALAGGVGYVVFDGKKLMNPAVPGPDTVMWTRQTQDCSSAATGSSIFDFDGDGRAEVVYSDEQYLRIMRGSDGAELFKVCNTTGTLIEYPLVADVDNDGQADLVVVSNSYSRITCPDDGSKQSGVRVFGDMAGKWVRTRRVWNQHGYHVTNVEEDGTIPKRELQNWKVPRLNNYRQNVQPQGEFSAPDLVVTAQAACDGSGRLSAIVRNVGEAAVAAPVAVGFYGASGTKIGSTATTRLLYPAESETVFVPANAAAGATFTAVVDDGMPAHPWKECRVDNNRSAPASVGCATPR
ncbi:MAG: VCBS repeat-containing protein [Polyangiaceae bacterium]